MRLPKGRPTLAKPKPEGRLTGLGRLLDIVVADGEDDVRIRPKGATDLLWRPMPRSGAPDRGWLVYWPGETFKLRPASPTGPAADAFERWSIWEADSEGSARLPWGRRFVTHDAVTIGYRSDKFSPTQTDYEHPFGPSVRLYRPARGAGPWVIKGGGLRLTPRGIEG